MWVCYNEENHQIWSQPAFLQDEKETIPHTYPKAKKILNRSKILHSDLKAGTAERNIV